MDFSESTRSVKDTQLEFILTELNTGLTLASLAKNGGKRGESRARARAAYDSVLRFLPRLPLTREESQKLQGKLEELKKQLEALGETF